MTGKWSKKKYILIYSLVFAVFALGSFFLFLKKHKSMIWEQDGGPQYYPYLIYLGQWLRDAAARALHGDFSVRMFDFSIGLGNDVGSVARTHPLELLSALVPAGGAEALYSAIILLRLYLAGLAFSLLSGMFRPLSLYTVTGSMIYVFSGFAMIFGVRHLIYGTAFIMLPLLIAGAERIIRGQKGWLFALAVFLGFICNYYFMYQATAACGVFVLLRLVTRKAGPDTGEAAFRPPALSDGESVRGLGADTSWRGILLLLARLAAFFLLGLGMAMFVMLPVAASLGASARLSSQSVPDNLLAYKGWRHYYRWFLNLITPVRSQAEGTALNYAVTAFPALVLMLAAPRRRKSILKGAFLIGTVCVLSPLCAYILSGFSTVSNRWIFCYSLVIGLAFVSCGEELVRTGARERRLLGAAGGLFLALAVFDWFDSRSVYLIFAAGELLVCLLVLAWVNRSGAARKYAPAILLTLTFASCTLGSILCCSGRYGNMLTEYLDKGQAMDNIRTSEFAVFGEIAAEQGAAGITSEEGAPFWRAESDLVTSNKENYSLVLGYAPTSVYNSVLSGPSTYFLLETGNSDLAAIHRIQGLDGRAVSGALANVRYYLSTFDGDVHAPYGFVRSERYSTEHNAVFENENPLPFGYTYDTVMARSDFDALDPLEREQAMLDAAVVSDEEAGALTREAGLSQAARASVTVEEEPLYLPETGVNVSRTKDGYRVKKGGGSISFAFRRRAGCEAVVRFTGFWLDHASNFAYVQTGRGRTEFSMRGPGYIYSLNRTEYYVRLGYDEEDSEDFLKLELPRKGLYHLESASICYIPMESYASRIAARSARSLQEVSFGVNTVRGKADLPERAVMSFSIPYSSGWRIYVDGEKAAARQVNVGWLGTDLPAGRHEITLRYSTPGAVPGRWISLFAWACFLALCLRRSGKRA